MIDVKYVIKDGEAYFSNHKPWMYKEPMIDLIETLEEYNVAFDIQEKDDFSLRFWIYDRVYKEFYLECRPWDSKSVYNLVDVITALYERKKLCHQDSQQTSDES